MNETKHRWSNINLLEGIKNPSKSKYTIKHISDELTFLGKKDFTGKIQPDYATIEITIVPDEYIIELKSLKTYLQDFRNRLMSYERLITVIYNDIESAYTPIKLKVFMKTNPRGGISSELFKGEL